MTTHVIMLIDKSGSMYPFEDDVRGGFNSYLDDLGKDTEVDYSVTVALFDDKYELLCNSKSPNEAPRLTKDNYQVSNSTALLDAVGKSITDFEKLGKLTEDSTDRVLLVINTDGRENSSHEFDNTTIRQMIADREAVVDGLPTGKWSVLYLGQHAEAWAEADNLGIRRGSTVSVGRTGGQTMSSYSSLSSGTGKFSRGASSDHVAKEVQDGQKST